MAYLTNVLIGIDQLANAVFAGWPDETFSARCWRCRDRYPFKVLRLLIDVLFWWDVEGHCRSSYESEKLRLQEPPELRST